MSQGDNARDYSDRNEQWSEILEAILPVLSKGFVAYGETCAAAVHYAGFYDEIKRCEFSALRPDFDTLLPELDQVCRKKGIVLQLPSGFTVEDSVPYAVVCARGEEVYLYPLDTIPDQVTLRFAVLHAPDRCRLVARHGGAYRVSTFGRKGWTFPCSHNEAWLFGDPNAERDW